MRSLLFVLFISLSFYPLTQEHISRGTPKECIESFFKSFHEQDTSELKSVIHEEIVVGTIIHDQKDTTLKVDNAHALYASLASIPDTLNFEESLLSIEVKEDGVLAHVWTPYEFYVNGEKSHQGVNAFTLLNTGEGWKIIYLVDTRRRE